jgi:hypothetical protein
VSNNLLLPASPLTQFADAIIQREALAARVGEGRLPRDFAGMYVDHTDVDRILGELPGLDGPDPQAIEAKTRHASEAIDVARGSFRSWLESADLFPEITRFARLSDEEAELLAVVLAVASDLRRQQLVAYVQDSVHLPQCSIWLLRRLFPLPHSGVASLSKPASLWRSGLIEISGDGPIARHQVCPADELVLALSDERVAGTLTPEAGERIGEGVPAPGLLLVPGSDRVRRLETVAWSGRYVVSPPPEGDSRWAELVRIATIGRCGLMLDPVDSMTDEARAWIARAAHLPWALGSSQELRLEELPPVGWREMPVDRGRVVGDDGWSLTATQASLASAAEEAYDGDRRRAVRRLAGGHLDSLALRIEPSRSWDELILPPDEKQQIAELTARYRQRFVVYEDWGFKAIPSSGLVALFAGPSGTGKTMAAEVVAGALGLDVFKIDLSSVVSKYIGETEKNISRVFDAAEAGRVLLFFDEADALFGKRSEVSDAHDRYANIEVSYLLQRLEAYEGLVVLATNLAKNIDQAFLRRIHASVEFPLPDEAARLLIWRQSMPEAAPVQDLDFEFLANQFRLSGGAIRNSALAAAFMAAEDGSPITMQHLAMGIKREFQKLGRLRTREEFGPYFEFVEGLEPTANGGRHAESA